MSGRWCYSDCSNLTSLSFDVYTSPDLGCRQFYHDLGKCNTTLLKESSWRSPPGSSSPPTTSWCTSTLSVPVTWCWSGPCSRCLSTPPSASPSQSRYCRVHPSRRCSYCYKVGDHTLTLKSLLIDHFRFCRGSDASLCHHQLHPDAGAGRALHRVLLPRGHHPPLRPGAA